MMNEKKIIQNFLLKGKKEQQKEKFEIAWDIWKNLEEIKKDMRKKVLLSLVNKIKNSKEFSKYEIKDNGLLNGQTWGSLRIYKKNWFLGGKVPLSLAVASEGKNYCKLGFGIEKWDEKEGIPFKGNWESKEESKERKIPNDWKNVFSRIYENLEKISQGWKPTNHWIVWKFFDSYYGNTKEKKFYEEIIEKGYEAVADHYFKELLKLKEATEDLIDKFVGFYKKEKNNQ